MAFPTKENVVTESVVFNGRKYNRYPESTNPAHRRYFIIGGGGQSLHRAIWEHYNGPIPDGWHIHHKDGDWNNNDISNLECIPAEEHRKEHKQYTSEFHKRPEHLAHLERIRPAAAEWHRSEEGRQWHKDNVAKNFKAGGAGRVALEKAREERRKNPLKLTCAVCQKPFEALISRAKFCSNTCACRSSRVNRRNKTSV